MSEQEWEAVKADQLRRYYRPVEAPVPAPAAPTARAERPSPALAPRRGGKRPSSNRRPAPAPITEDENII